MSAAVCGPPRPIFWLESSGLPGHEAYQRARSGHRGVIVVTAHMGSFEVGLAALRAMEPHIHVVFRRDEIGQFERRRSQLRRRLGDQRGGAGRGMDRLDSPARCAAGEPGGSAARRSGDARPEGERVAFLGGHLELPDRPAPPRAGDGRADLACVHNSHARRQIRLFVEEPISACRPRCRRRACWPSSSSKAFWRNT